MHQRPGKRPLWREYWSRLGTRMTVSYVLVTVGAALIGELSMLLILFTIQEPPSADSVRSLILLYGWFKYGWLKSVLFLLVVTVPIGVFFGFITTRKLVQRVQRLVKATTHFASGDYTYRVPCSKSDEIGQLEHYFNRMVAQLAESNEQRQTLIEQNARLSERARIARDLHDSIKQHLFAVSMQVGAALSHVDQDSQVARTHLLEADMLTYQAQQELTTLIQELRPSPLQAKGLVDALSEHLVMWSRLNDIKAETSIEDVGVLPIPTEEALFRIGQEALSNVARHSGATMVRVELARKEDQITQTITDNGQGFDSTQRESRGLGLQSMRERIDCIGGTIQVHSKSGSGTQVMVCCPAGQNYIKSLGKKQEVSHE
ncbi:MAG: sensor histidine kinase [Ktedonobacteraceae bacterium]|nr:sensor histidine kinase [Ktedonobacteraceae bacterium]MBO0791563.1 sensor histidine kinase [Ktedonobacteraceae bacterium]